MTNKLLIFDFDGTLADSFDWFINAINIVGRRFQLRPLDRDEAEALRGLSAAEVLAPLKHPSLGDFPCLRAPCAAGCKKTSIRFAGEIACLRAQSRVAFVRSMISRWPCAVTVIGPESRLERVIMAREHHARQMRRDPACSAAGESPPIPEWDERTGAGSLNHLSARRFGNRANRGGP